MRIATNTPFSFPLKDGYELLHLGERASDVSIIVLMLQKDWGGNSIEQIDSLTKCILSYPAKVPCYIIGCELTIPTLDLKSHIDENCDRSIRGLCDEVLTRSKSIGVRGEITYRYLTEILGYPKDRIDIIYVENSDDNRERIQSFLKDNDCKMHLYAPRMVLFQVTPWKFAFDRNLNAKKEIIIDKPYITSSDTGVRLNADIDIDGQIKTLWCETDEAYRRYLLSERADAFLCLMLPFAMRSGQDIVCKAPVTEQFLHNLSEILVPQLSTYDPRLHRTRISAAGDPSAVISGDAVATGMSCGVDSLYTASLYNSSPFKSMNLTHLYVGNYLYGNAGEIYDRAAHVARDMGLPLVRTSTNIMSELRMPHLPTHFFKTMFGVLSLRKLFRIYYYSTTEDFSHFDLKGNGAGDTSHIELLLMYTFTCSDLQLITGGVKQERAEKTRELGNFEVATKYLNVCLNPHAEINCGKCGKCRRTLLTLDVLGILDQFRDVFPIEEYRRTRFDSLVYLFSHSKSTYLSEVFNYLMQNEPDIMKQAEEEYLRRSKKPVKSSPAGAKAI